MAFIVLTCISPITSKVDHFYDFITCIFLLFMSVPTTYFTVLSEVIFLFICKSSLDFR